jgi:hypothetical protein
VVAVVVLRCLLVAVASELDAPIDTRKHVGFLSEPQQGAIADLIH